MYIHIKWWFPVHMLITVGCAPQRKTSVDHLNSMVEVKGREEHITICYPDTHQV